MRQDQDPDLLAIASNAAPGQSPPDLMLAAVHYPLASDGDDPLARYYPSLRFAAATGDPVPDFRRFCLQRRGELVELISSRRVQTNEVSRCCYLLPAVILAGRLAGRPLALIEPGASAGLNLAMDAYAYDYGTPAKVGDTGSRLLLHCRLDGPLQPPLNLPVPHIAWRAGIDINPLDPADPQDAAWLRALVWPDHPTRVWRLKEALRIAACRPTVPMYAGDALEQLPAAVDAAPPETAVCVFHTAFLAHFSQVERDRFTRQALAASRRRTIYWIQAEPRRAAATAQRLRQRPDHHRMDARALPPHDIEDLDGWTLHRLRHSALTHDAEDGTSTPMLLARSRHASVRSLERYDRPGVDSVARHVAERDPAARRRT